MVAYPLQQLAAFKAAEHKQRFGLRLRVRLCCSAQLFDPYSLLIPLLLHPGLPDQIIKFCETGNSTSTGRPCRSGSLAEQKLGQPRSPSHQTSKCWRAQYYHGVMVASVTAPMLAGWGVGVDGGPAAGGRGGRGGAGGAPDARACGRARLGRAIRARGAPGAARQRL